MPDPLQSLLRWSIENSETNPNSSSTSTTSAPRAALHPSDSESHVPTVSSFPNLAPNGANSNSNSNNDVAGTAGSGKPKKALTSEMLDALMGPSDAEVMKDKMRIALDEGEDVNERVFALDDFEMLIESIDNANNIEPLGLWPPLLGLLSAPQDAIIRAAAWVVGTAIQNNPKAQESFHSHSPLPTLLSLISSTHPTSSSHSPSISSQTRSKSVYALSAALKHYPAAQSLLDADDARGWRVLKAGLRDPDGVVRRKVAFLLGTLIMQCGEGFTTEDGVTDLTKKEEAEKGMMTTMRTNEIFPALLESITHPLPLGPDGDSTDPDWDMTEKSFRALMGAVEKGGLGSEEKAVLKGLLERWRREGGEEGWGIVGVGEEEGKGFLEVLSA